jgi:antitoxin YefM
MTTITASEAREALLALLGQVNDDHIAITITSKAGNGVLISEEDYEAWRRTVHLFSSPANALRLAEAIERSEHGDYAEHELGGA